MNRVTPITASDRKTALFWLLGFLFLQMLCQMALLMPQFSSGRVIFRTAAFLTSLVALFLVAGQAPRSMIRNLLLMALAIVALAIFHVSTNTPLAGLAQAGLYLAIVAPFFWVGRLRMDSRVFYWVIGFLWFFHTISATVGVLQTLYPGRFEMERTTVLRDTVGEEGLKITLADGSVIFRPTGLTDSPGGASSAGFLACVFGLGFLTTSRRLPVQLLAVPAIGIGLYCIYVCQVRVNVILVIIGTIVFMAGLLIRGQNAAFMRLLVVLPLIVIVSLVAAASIGGESTLNRLLTLVEESPDKVYANNRGRFLEHTITDLVPQYPMGAGLGRWGMIRGYFGDEGNLESPPIWVEIQITAWVLDGGIPLVLVYGLAVVSAAVLTLRTALRCPDPWLSTWGLLVTGYDIAVIATVFSYVPFIGQMGLEFWLFNAAYWATVRSLPRRPESTS